jgi:hypothetical protein
MRINHATPYSRLVDGKLNSWTAIQPLQDAEFTIKLKTPVTVASIAVSVTVHDPLPVAKAMAFLADGERILEAELAKERGQQKFALSRPATFRNLTVRVLSVYPGEGDWGSIGEIEGFDSMGRNVLLNPPRQVARTSPEEVFALYREIKQADPSRPVLVTFTGNFFEKATRYDRDMRSRLYPAYAEGADVLGFDIYPIYGSGFPSRLNWVADATEELVSLASPNRPVYAWIETSKGSKWMTLSRQLDVEPKHTRCETWMAIIRGATAIGYFTHRWRPDYKQFAPQGKMVTELRRLNGQITRLAPAILAPPAKNRVEIALNGGLPCHVKATRLGDTLYIFAQNIDLGPDPEKKRQFEQITPRAGTAVIRVPGLQAGTRVDVVDEDRVLTAAQGRFTDGFPPLAEHVYRIRM